MNKLRLIFTFLASATVPCAAAVHAGDWPHWRGPGSNDIIEESSGWKAGLWLNEMPIWEAEVGEGSTSPLVVGGRLYVMGWIDVKCFSVRPGGGRDR